MRISNIKLTKFRRFADLEVKDIPSSAKLVVLAGVLLLLPGLLMLVTSTKAQKRRTAGSTPRAAQPAAQFKTCPVCNGSGKTHEHVTKYEEVRCSNCAATGKIICDGGDRALNGARTSGMTTMMGHHSMAQLG